MIHQIRHFQGKYVYNVPSFGSKLGVQAIVIFFNFSCFYKSMKLDQWF